MIVALDIDRTIFDTTYFLEVLYEQCLRAGADESLIAQFKSEELAARGRSFDAVYRLQSQRILPDVASLYPYTTQMLYEGVEVLIGSLELHQVPYVLLTYGSELAQRYKIALIEHVLGRNVLFHITAEPNKSTWLEQIEYQGVFSIPINNSTHSVDARSIILVDDKLSNLQTTHPHIHPILIDNSKQKVSTDGISISEVWAEILRIFTSSVI